MTFDPTLPANRLADEPSAYLRVQAHQPVDWYPWGEEAFRVAAEEDKPILLSIGHGSSSACRQMERESFEDERTAALLRTNFVCIKVDRDERPDLAAHFLDVRSILRGEPGYPITMFLTSQGKPFHGGSYYPPEPRDGLPAFGSVLDEVALLWHHKRDHVYRTAEGVEQQIGRRPAVGADEPLSPALVQEAVLAIQARFDEENGGFGPPPKSPQPPVLELLLRASSKSVPGATKAVELTLRKMALGAIYDQVGGGFHGFARDAAWQLPDFSKALHDNAQLARVYTHAWQLLRKPLYRRIALDTLEYLQRDLAAQGGVFYAGESFGGEGAYYTWSYDEFQAVAPQAAGFFGVTPSGNLDGRNVLTAASDDPPTKARAALFKSRGERSRPVRDEKVLTSWNGLAVAALAEAGAAFDRIDLVEAARRAMGWLLHAHRDRATGRLLHSYGNEEHKVLGMLEDYAFVAEGLYTLWEVTFEPEWVDACDRLCREMLELFWDPAGGGLFTTAEDHEPLIPRRKEYLDSSTPSGAAVASTLLRKLAVLSGEQELADRSRTIVDQAPPKIRSRLWDATAMVTAVDFNLSNPTEIVILGSAGDSRTRALRQQLWERYLPNKVCAGAPPGIESPLLEGKVLVNDAPTAHVTQGGLLKPPVNEPHDLAEALKFWTAPPNTQVRKVTELISNAVQRRHFFDNLKNPAWIQPLKQAGLFEAAPDPIYDYTEETVGSPPWAQSRYLARMAPFSPQEVKEVSLQVADAGNVQVHEDLADVALAIPANLAGSFVPKAKEWLKSPYQLHLPEKLGKLLRRLAEGGRIEEAVELTAALFEVRAEENPQARSAFQTAPEPRARFRKYDYEQILRDQFPALVKAAPLKALSALCELLESAIDLSFPEGEGEGPNDYSYLWRPAIYPSEQNADKTLRESLASVLVESVEQIARDQPHLVPTMVDLLESRDRHIFARTALHLLRVWPETAPEKIVERLMDRRLFEDPHFHHEYLLLARDHFEELTADQQATIFEWISEGPDLHLWLSDPDSPLPDDWSAERAEKYSERWQLKRLSVLEEYLSEEQRARLERLSEAHGREDHGEYVVHYAGNRLDPTTPIQAEDLHYNRLDDVLEHLARWKPTPGLGNPTVEGLALKLAQVVATEAAKFAKSARRFKGLDPLYIWAMLQGLREGAEAFTFDWAPVLDLCAWTVENQDHGEPGRWRAVKIEAARILSKAFSAGSAQMPFELRGEAWRVLRPLTDDPDPSPDAVSSPEPSQQSVSSVRGEAMHAVIRYALWLRRYFESDRDAMRRLKEGLGLMPEVREVLELHLDLERDPSPAIRSVYGRWFAWLMMLDATWATARVREIFPQDKALEPLRDAAWEALISYSPAYDHLLRLIEPEYERGVDLVHRFEQRPQDKVHPENRLAEHLMVFYLRGKLAFEAKGMLTRFFSNASVRLRRHALGFIGRSLNNQEGRVPLDFEMRLKRLWERRLEEAVKAGDPSSYSEELAAFGWWFASGKLNPAWSLTQLQRVLELGVRVENATQVVERLKDLAERHASKCVECLAAILKGEQDSISLLAWAEDCRVIIDRAMESDDDRARSLGIELLSFFDVRELEELVRWE